MYIRMLTSIGAGCNVEHILKFHEGNSRRRPGRRSNRQF